MIRNLRYLAMLVTLGLSAADGFRNCGVATNVAEARGAVVTRTKAGRSLVLVNGVDAGTRAYMVVVDIDSGETQLIMAPPGIGHGTGAFGSMLSANGKFYTGRGKVLLEFDPESQAWTWHGIPSPKSQHFMSFAEEPGGALIWGAMYPTCMLVSYDPKTRTAKEHGRLDPAEQYPQSLALDDQGWVYAGIGTARCNLVGYQPATGTVRKLLPETERKHGTAVVRPAGDGSVLGTANGKTYRLHNGEARPYAKREKKPAAVTTGSVYYGRFLKAFPDGRTLRTLNLPDKFLVIQEKGGPRRIELTYDCGGAGLTSVRTGPGGMVYASSAHPMHLARLDPESGKIADLGAVPKIGGGNFCSMATDGSKLYGVEYAGGRLWAYDPAVPWHPGLGERTVTGIPAAELVKSAKAQDGHFSYLKSEDLAFLCGDRFGAVGDVMLKAPKDGRYFVEFVPFHYTTYCRVQFSLGGQPLGKPYDPTGGEGIGPQQSFGPFELKAGAHALRMAALETPGQKPWCSLVTAALRPAGEPPRQLVISRPENPAVLAQWKQDICRPRAALLHPDRKHVLMAGFAGYGLCGGGIGIFGIDDRKGQLLTAERDLLPSHSPICLAALPNGNIVAGTSVTAPGGGRVAATQAELMLLDWKTRKLLWHGVPIHKDRNVIGLLALPGGRVCGIGGTAGFFVFDPKIPGFVHHSSLFGYGGVPRHPLHLDPDGQIYALFAKAILRLDPRTFAPTKLADTPAPITAGGTLIGNTLCFASKAEIWTYTIPQAKK